MDEREPPIDTVGNRPAERSAVLLCVVIPIGHVDITLEAIRRLIGNDVDRAARAVAAIQGTLRAFEDFDATNIEQCEGLRCGRTHVEVIDIEAVRPRIVGIVLVEANTSDRYLRLIAL